MVVSIIANFETTSYISKNGDSVIEANNSMIDGPIEELDSLKGWVAVGFAFVSMFICFGVVYSFGAFFDPMALEFKASSSETSAVFSITTFMFLTGGVVSGMVADRIGSRPVLIFGGFAMGLGLYLTSLVNSLWIGYITYGVGVGVGVACGYVPMVAVVGAWFEKRRAAALGISVTGVGDQSLRMAPDLCHIWRLQCCRIDFVWLFNTSPTGARRATVRVTAAGIGKNTCIWVHVFLRFFPIAGAFLSDCISRILCHSSGYR
jgi:hypothetical protein